MKLATRTSEARLLHIAILHVFLRVNGVLGKKQSIPISIMNVKTRIKCWTWGQKCSKRASWALFWPGSGPGARAYLSQKAPWLSWRLYIASKQAKSM